MSIVMRAAQRLRLEAATAEVVRAFTGAGVDSILLKGASIAQWLYLQGEPRSWIDCDLLVPPFARRRAQEVLVGLGFEPQVDEGEMPSWWQEHGTEWSRSDDGAAVDLHRTLEGVGVSPEALWQELAGNVETALVGGAPVTMLTVPGRALHLALHVAQHGREWGRTAEDLRRALSLGDDAMWERAAALAARLEATSAFAAGLRILPQGRDLAARLQLPSQTAVDVELRANRAPPVALGFDQLDRAEGPIERLRILRHKVMPPATFMRSWSPLARKGTLGLIIAYVWRPIWLIMSAPAGFKAWRAARRRVGR